MVRGGVREGSGRKKNAGKRVGVSMTLSPVALAALEGLAHVQGVSKSEVVERLLLGASQGGDKSGAVEVLGLLLEAYNKGGVTKALLEPLRLLWEQHDLMPHASDKEGWKVYDKHGPSGYRAYRAKQP